MYQLSAQTFNIFPLCPYDFDLNCRIFGYEKPMPEVYEGGIWRRGARLCSDKLVPVELRSVGTIEEPKIEVKIFKKAIEKEKEELSKILDSLFSFSKDLTALYSFMNRDPVLRELKQRFCGLKAGSIGATVFESIVKSIIQQQISIKVAFLITNKMVTRFGEHIKPEGTVYYFFPTPKRLARANLEEIKQCGVSWRKAEYIKTLAEKAADGTFDPEGLKLLDNEQVVETLKKFRGIGTWTAEMVLAAGLKRETAIPAGDLGVRRTFSKLYSNGKLLSETEVRKIADNWQEFTKDIVFYISCIERD